MSSYSPLAWHDFFVAAVGASAALLGLLFVTVSINLEHILKYPHLPGRAASTLGTLLTVLVICCFGLAPSQSSTPFGWEILTVTLLVATQIIWTSRHRDPADPLKWTLRSLPILLIPVAVLLGGGISLLAGGGGGIYWILFGTALVFIGASINAWVLLVEILR
jgi:hypothetical protein